YVVEVDAQVLLDVVLDLAGAVAVDLEAAGDGVGDLDPWLIWVQVEPCQERVEYVPAVLVVAVLVDRVVADPGEGAGLAGAQLVQLGPALLRGGGEGLPGGDLGGE